VQPKTGRECMGSLSLSWSMMRSYPSETFGFGFAFAFSPLNFLNVFAGPIVCYGPNCTISKWLSHFYFLKFCPSFLMLYVGFGLMNMKLDSPPSPPVPLSPLVRNFFRTISDISNLLSPLLINVRLT